MSSRSNLSALLLLLILAACVPSQVPPPRAAEGTPFVIADGVFESGGLRVRIPAGWRVVTGEAGAPLLLTLVTPDECGVIVVSAAPLDAPVRSPACADLPLREELRTVEAGGVAYSVSASAPEEAWAAFAREVAGVMRSLRSE